MITAVGICFRRGGRIYWFDPAGLDLGRGDKVVAETAAGPELGEVKITPREITEEGLSLPLKPVLRQATVEDLRRANENKLRETSALRTAVEKAAQFGLPMKVIAAECTFDRSKTVFHFAAEGRVDFRELARELARTLKCRVELHQVGVRDEAKLLGGLGTCGRELCCASFLADFEPVGIKMAKEQDLSLNPQKISGACGRLMCCLAYEYPCYKEVRKRLPRMGSKIPTPKGPGRLVGIDVPREEALIALEEGGDIRVPLKEITTSTESNGEVDKAPE